MVAVNKSLTDRLDARELLAAGVAAVGGGGGGGRADFAQGGGPQGHHAEAAIAAIAHALEAAATKVGA